MLLKEAITEVARHLKKNQSYPLDKVDHSYTRLLDNLPTDLSEQDIRLALRAMEIVSNVILKIQ